MLALDRVRFAGEPVAAVAAEDEAAAEAAAADDRRRIRGAAGRRHARGGDRRRRAARPRGPLRPGLFHGLGELLEERGRQRLLPLPARLRQRRGWRRGGGRAEVEGEYVFPAVYQYAMETHTVVCRLPRGRHHALGLLPAPVPRPGRDRRPVQQAAQHGPRDRALPRRRLRLEVVHEDGADHRGAGAEGGAPGADPEQRRGVDGDDAPPRHALPGCGPRRTRDGKLLSREVRFGLDTGAYADNGPRVCATAGDAAPGPYRWRCRPRGRATASTPTPRPPAPTAPSAPSTCSGSGRSQVDEVARRAGIDPLEMRRRNLLTPGRARAPRRQRQAARRRPDRRRREGGGRDRLGRARSATGPGAGSRSGCSPPARTRSRAPTCAWSPTAASR